MDKKYTNETTNKDNNSGQNQITQKGSLLIEDNIIDGYVVHKISHVLDSVVKVKGVDPNVTATDHNGDPRVINTLFGFPSTRSDIAMLNAFQKTVAFYMKNDYNSKVSKYYFLSKDIDKTDFQANAFVGKIEDQSIGMRAFIEDKDGFFGGSKNAIIRYFDKIPVYPFNKESVLKNLFASDKFITDGMYADLKLTFPNKTVDTVESFNSDDIDELDENFGVAIPTYKFKLNNYNDDVPEYFSYTIEVNNPGLTTNFMSILRIPDWFVQGNISKFVEELDKNYSAAFLKLGDFTWLNPDGSFIQEEPPTNEPTNPGYPFIEANYNTAPFGSSANAFEARQKLAQKFGFDGYFAYKGTKSIDDRKADWDNSSDIW